MALPNVINEINTIKSTYLPLSGGTLTGIINRSGYLARSGNESNILAMISGTDVKHGAGLWLAGNSYSGSVPAGAFRLQCYNPTTQVYTSLTGTNTGSLTWNGGEVITSKGGTFSGTIMTTNTVGLVGSGNYVDVGYRYSDNNGAIMAFRSSSYTNNPGGFEIFARNGTNTYSLNGRADTGNLSWGNKNVVCVTYYRSGASWYRKYSDGFIEQGGNVTPSAAWTKISLITAFSNTNYQIIVSTTDPDTNGSINGVAWRDKTTSSFSSCSAYNGTFYSSVLNWYACGY